MAGRGRGMTLPAWMTKDGVGGGDPAMAAMPQMPGGLNGADASQNHFGNGSSYPVAPAQGQFADPMVQQHQQPQHQPPHQVYASAPPPQQHVPPPAPAPAPVPERESRRRRSPSPRGDRHSRRSRDSRSPPRGGYDRRGGGGY
ncbi:unnamed protein product, partial [Sphacelaria rigidula]